ncbi:HIT domain-containing protein [Sarocladium implicatum]|nr:HIT domain-containing protein [Sarocladium implicatum]
MAASSASEKIYFGPFEVTSQVFLKTPYSFGLINHKPIQPGHILICSRAAHPRLTDLSAAETTDLFTTVQLAQRLLARVHFPDPTSIASGSFNVGVQDGAAAGQTVPHVHVHIIPRVEGDLENSDDIYVKMNGEEGNVGGALWDVKERPRAGGAFEKVDDEDRKARELGDMRAEVEKYQAVLKEMGVDHGCGA